MINEWLAEFWALQQAQARRDLTGEHALRRALAELWDLSRRAGQQVATEFRELSQDELTTTALGLEAGLVEGRLLALPATSNARDAALALGARLRAIDTELTTRSRFIHPPAGPNTYLVPEVDAFVIPRRDAKLQDARIGPGRGFGRRGTPHHRILPRTIGDFEVELVWDVRLSAGKVSGTEQLLGAALLPGMVLKHDPSRDNWVALSADCPDAEQLIAGQVEAAYDGEVLAMAYPELSMPSGRQASLMAALRERSAQCDAGRGPAIVVAGSWHEDDGDDVRNVMRVLDKTGRERLAYAKTSAYCRDTIKEGIVVGRRIPVLVNIDFLATFALCLDFCERELPTPYDQLDVDLVIVASHGNEQTMKGHEANSGDFHIRFGGQVFVVQHHDRGRNPVGFVLPKTPDGAGFGEDRPWSTRTIAFS